MTELDNLITSMYKAAEAKGSNAVPNGSAVTPPPPKKQPLQKDQKGNQAPVQTTENKQPSKPPGPTYDSETVKAFTVPQDKQVSTTHRVGLGAREGLADAGDKVKSWTSWIPYADKVQGAISDVAYNMFYDSDAAKQIQNEAAKPIDNNASTAALKVQRRNLSGLTGTGGAPVTNEVKQFQDTLSNQLQNYITGGGGDFNTFIGHLTGSNQERAAKVRDLAQKLRNPDGTINQDVAKQIGYYGGMFNIGDDQIVNGISEGAAEAPEAYNEQANLAIEQGVKKYAPYVAGIGGIAGLASMLFGGRGGNQGNGGYGNGGYGNGGYGSQNELLEYLKQYAPNDWYKSKNWGKPNVS